MSMSLSPPTDPSLQTVVSPIQIPKPAPIETNEKALPPRPVGPGPTSASATRTKSPSSSRVDRLFSPFSTPSRTKLVADDDVPTDTQYTEDELREIFEEEEMQRFLNAFHAVSREPAATDCPPLTNFTHLRMSGKSLYHPQTTTKPSPDSRKS